MSTHRTTLRAIAAVALVWTAVTTVPTVGAEAASRIERGSRTVAPLLHARTAVDAAAPHAGMFGPGSEWRRDVSTAPVAANSAAMVANLVGQVQQYYGGVAAFNVNQYNTNVYTVPVDQPRADVVWDDCQGKGYVPRGLYGPGGQFTQVPIPATAVPAKGTDAELTVYSPATDQLWEFWRTRRVDGVWHACWGGRIDGVSTSPGFFTGGFGASASGLALAAGQVGIREAQAGTIGHALQLEITRPGYWKTPSWPAQRGDGWDQSADQIPTGTRFRLDPSFDVAASGMTPLAKMIAKAAQQYGFIVTDKSGGVAVTAESSAAVVAAGGTDPWPVLMSGKPSYKIMEGFPWHRMQALPRDYGKPPAS